MPLTHQSEANVRGGAQDPSQTMPCLKSAASSLGILKALPLRIVLFFFPLSFQIRLFSRPSLDD